MNDVSSPTTPARPAAAATRSPLEAALGGLWANMLRLKRVDPDADFFLLGGDSLRGVALLDEVRRIFGVEIPVAALFEDAGTVAGMARRIGLERASSRRPPAPLLRRDPAAPIPLSQQQARVWFLQRLDPAAHAYHEVRWWRLEGDLDVDALRAALRAVALRQAVMRTRYVSVDGEPRQVVDAEPDWSLDLVDLAGEADPEAAAATLLEERKRRPFDLAAGAPFRATLVRVAPGRWRFHRVWHHIMSDGLASGVFQDDLSEAYAAAREGRAPRWRPLAAEYADFAVWQAREADSPAVRDALEAQRARLDGVPALALPVDFARPAVQSYEGDVVTVEVPVETHERLRELARAQGATAVIAWFSAFLVLLHRLTGEEDFAVGTPVSGRIRPELAPLVGFFANTLAVRADLGGAPGFVEVLRRARARFAEALERQQVPFERLVDALGVPRDPSRNPVFQTAFGMREDRARDLAFDGVRVERDLARARHAKFDLSLFVLEHEQGVRFNLEYATRLFARSSAERMAAQLLRLVQAVLDAPRAPIGSLPLLDAAAERAVVEASRGRAGGYPAGATVPAAFAEVVARDPRAEAFAGVDYATLDARADGIARELAAAGAGPGARVAVALSRAEDIAAAWLGVLKAGAAYLPIDPALPAERIGFLFDDARVAHLVTESALFPRLERTRMRAILVDRPAAAGTGALPAPSIGPDDPAYVIYTSGSTGEPKGVVVPHRAILRLVRGADYVQLAPGDRVAQLAQPAFDASTFEFWGALLNGATLVPIAKATALAPREFAAAIERGRVDVLFVTTALFNAVARDRPDAFRRCRAVLFGGEAVEVGPVRAVLASAPPARLLHVYGPTEATTFATWHEVRDLAPEAATVPIGGPIANTDAWVLRDDGGLAADGEPGELVLAGPGLALGYLHRDALTAERFVERDLGAAGRVRVYRTGDRVRRRGRDIEFLGRRDRQVKLRGFRIELDEVEAMLARLPQVGAAAVMLRGETSDTRKLVAWLVPRDPQGPPPEHLWREMKRRMPEWMLPGAVVWLPALPLNANGKVDRRALPAPADEAAAGVGQGVRIEPRDMLEGTVASIWGELLGIASPGVHDHFFEVGGHSLLAARLVDAIEKRTGVAIPLTALFVDDTIAGLAARLRDGARFDDEPITAFHDDAARPPFVYLHGDFTAGGFYSRALAHAIGADQPVLVVHPIGLGAVEVPDSIEAMAALHVQALRAARPRGPYMLGGHCNGALVAFEMARQLEAAGERVPLVVVVESSAPAGRPDAPQDGVYARIGAMGELVPLGKGDRAHDLNVRYARAIDRYAGGPFGGRTLVIMAESSSKGGTDGGWSGLVPQREFLRLPGDHRTLLTVHLERVAESVRAAIARALADEARP